MVAAIGALMVKIKSVGFGNVIGKTKQLRGQWGQMTEQMKPQIDALTKGMAKFGAIATGALAALIAASPRLQAEFEILTIRVEEFLRPFGDELAPLVRTVSDLVDDLADAFKELPKPIQDAATFAVGLTISLGVAAGVVAGLIMLLGAIPPTLLLVLGGAFIFKLGWDLNWLDVQGTVERVVLALGSSFDNLVKMVEALQEGDLPSALDALVLMFGFALEAIGRAVFEMPIKFVQGVSDVMEKVKIHFVLWGAKLVKSFNEGIKSVQIDFSVWFLQFIEDMEDWIDKTLPKFVEFGVSLISGFVKGIAEGLVTAGGLFDAFLADIAGFFGGSLPEKGPLMHIERFGQELGEAYILAIGSGIESQTRNTNQTMNIQNVNLGMREEEFRTERSFFDGMDEGIRRSTSF